ncbi:hypothetical protein CON98_33335, partial [Bacillus toyonensis]
FQSVKVNLTSTAIVLLTKALALELYIGYCTFCTWLLKSKKEPPLRQFPHILYLQCNYCIGYLYGLSLYW